MVDTVAELKDLRLHGLGGAWKDLTTRAGQMTDARVQTLLWLIEHLLRAECAQRAFASVRHQVKAARLPLHRYLAGFDFRASNAEQKTDQAMECAGLNKHGLKRLAPWDARHGQDAPGHRRWGDGHCGEGETGALYAHFLRALACLAPKIFENL